MGGHHQSASNTEKINTTKKVNSNVHHEINNDQSMNDFLNDHRYFEGEDVGGDNDYYEDLVNQGGTMIIKLMNLDDLDMDEQDHDLDMIVSKKDRKIFKKKLGATTCDILYSQAHQNPLFNSKTRKGVEFRTRLQTKLADYC